MRKLYRVAWLAALAFAALLFVTRDGLPALLRIGHDPEALPPQRPGAV